MNKYEFRVILDGSIELTEEVCDELYAAGCDDGTPGVCDGVFSVDFHREAQSLESAINSAIKSIETAGHKVGRVEIAAAAMPQSA